MIRTARIYSRLSVVPLTGVAVDETEEPVAGEMEDTDSLFFPGREP